MLDVLVAIFIFHNRWFILGFMPLYFLYRKTVQQKREQEEQKQVRNEFLIFLQSLESYIFLGYATEHAFIEGEKELLGVIQKPGSFTRKLIEMNKKRAVGEGIEGLFLKYTRDFHVEEVQLFAQVLCFLQQKGGDICGLVHSTSEKIRWMVDMENQMEVVYAAKKMEAKVMMLAPIGILLFLNYSNREYMSWYYENIFGGFMLLVFLMLYLAAMACMRWILNTQEKG